MDTDVLEAIVNTLQEAITHRDPFCTGTIPLSEDGALLYFKRGPSSASWIDLANATEAGLQRLSTACEPATFGLQERNVLDETYRKASKMDKEKFLASFDLKHTGIVDQIKEQLLSAKDESKPVSAELYKLNVYGEGSFFKSHKDTPLSKEMFGSLVVVFPTPHEGGALVLRHGDEEWTFDSSEILNAQEKPSVAYIAFYSDVDHEVNLVESGYRVTLTYNLYFKDDPEAIAPCPLPDPHLASENVDSRFKAALSSALANPQFFPDGGLLGFGLRFKYPVDRHSVLSRLRLMLKGSDATIKRVCDDLSLDASLCAIYEDQRKGIQVMMDHIEATVADGLQVDEGVVSALCEQGGQVIYDWPGGDPPDRFEDAAPVLWVTSITTYSQFDIPYVHYGNEASLDYVYANLCLVVEVGPPGKRTTLIPSDEQDASSRHRQDIISEARSFINSLDPEVRSLLAERLLNWNQDSDTP